MKHILFLFFATFLISCSPQRPEPEPVKPEPKEEVVRFNKVVEQCTAQPELPWCEPA